MILGFTGTQYGMTPYQASMFVTYIHKFTVDEFHHGMCIGADELAERLVRKNFPNVTIHGHPPKISAKKSRTSEPNVIYPPKDYLVRNHDIVDVSHLLIATPFTFKEQVRSGTWSTIRYAWQQNVPVYIITPSPQ